MQNNLILRTVNSPYGDVTKGSVLSHSEVDGNFIYLKGELIYTATTTGNTVSLRQLNGDTINFAVIASDITITGGTFSAGTLTLINNTGGTFTVTGITSTDTYVTGATPNNGLKTYTFVNNTGGTFSVLGLTDITITGGTYSAGTATFTNNTGGTFSVTGFNTSVDTDTYVTGGTYNGLTGTATFTNNTGGTFTVTGFTTGTTGFDVFVTGATTDNGLKTYTFVNNTGGTFTVNGLTDITITGGTFTAGTATFTNNTGGTFTVTGFTTGSTSSNAKYTITTGLTSGITVTVPHNLGTTDILLQVTDLVTNALVFVTIDNYQLNSVDVTSNVTMGSSRIIILAAGGSGSSSSDIYVTGGTYNNSIGTATFTNNSGASFTVTGFTTGSTGSTSFSITTNVIPKGTGSTITDGTWAFSGNTLYPLTDESNIGISGTNRVDTIYLASRLDYASNLILSSAGTETARFSGKNFGVNTTGDTAYLVIGNSETPLSSATFSITGITNVDIPVYNNTNNIMYVGGGNSYDIVYAIDCVANTASTISLFNDIQYTYNNGLTYNSIDNTLYVSVVDNDTGTIFDILVIDCNTSTVSDVVTGFTNNQGLTYNSTDNTVYVIDTPSNIVHVIDCNTNSISTGITITNPISGVYNSTDNTYYVTYDTDDILAVIDCNTNTIIDVVTGFTDGLYYMVHNPINNFLYVPILNTPSDRTLYVVDCNTNSIVDTVSFDSNLIGPTYDVNKNLIYISHLGETVSILDPNTNTVLRTVSYRESTSSGTVGAFNSINNQLWFIDFNTNSVIVLNTNFNSNTSSLLIRGFTNDMNSNILETKNLENESIFLIRNDKRIIYTDGNEASGKTLKSDASGVATWGTDLYVTGGTFTAGTATFRNNIGGTFTVTGFTSSVNLGSQIIFVSKDGNDSTGTNKDITRPYLTISGATAKAATLSPSATNVINIVILPGTYVESVTMSTSFVNLITFTSNELIFNSNTNATIITASGSGRRPVYVNGTITVTADNVNLIGVNCDNLVINNLSTNSNFAHMVVGTAISTTAATVNGVFYDMHSPSFFTNTVALTLSGFFQYCSAQGNSYASSTTVAGGNISGRMIDCIATTNSFGSTTALNVNSGNLTGTFINCRCSSFGNFSSCNTFPTTGNSGTLSGTFTNCNGGTSSNFGFSNSGIGGTLSGKFNNCIGGTTTGNFGCTFIGTAGTLSGDFFNCQGGTTSNFGSATGSATGGGTFAGTLSGNFIGCTSGGNSFGSGVSGAGVGTGTTAGTISGYMEGCRSTGTFSFASCGGTGGTISNTARLMDCYGAGNDFACGTHAGGTIAGQLHSCLSTTGGFASAGNSSGNSGGNITNIALLKGCISGSYGFGTAGAFASGDIGGVIDGNLIGCRDTDNSGGSEGSFAAGITTRGLISGTLEDCDTRRGVALSRAAISGKINRCKAIATNSTTIGAYVIAGGRIVNSEIRGNGAFSIDGDIGTSADVRRCDLFGGGYNSANITLVTGTPYNTDDSNSYYI